jgi:His-Xaa-Ser system radical SAM maturase HxsC
MSRRHIDPRTSPLAERQDRDAFVVRLGDEAQWATHDGQVVLRSDHGAFAISAAQAPDWGIGDVLIAYPRNAMVVNALATTSNANTLMLTEACDQRCIMCSQPPRNYHHAYYALYDRVVDLAPPKAVIGLSGGEPTLLADSLFPWLCAAVERRPDITYHLLSNGQHLTTDHRGPLTRLRDHILWGIPLYGARAEVHDHLVRKVGAYPRLLESFDLLASCGAAVEVRTVINSLTWPELPLLADFLGRHLPWVVRWAVMQMEYQGFAKAQWRSLFVDTSQTQGALQAAAAIAAALRLPIELFNVPLCTLPASLRPLAHPTISDWKQAFASDCAPCSQRAACGGFFAWNHDHHGYSGVHAL